MVSTLIPPGTWGSNLLAHTVVASNDATVQGFGVWPPAFFIADQNPVAGIAERARLGALTLVFNYLFTFDTSFVTRLQSVVRAVLRLEVRLLMDTDGLQLRNDNFSWGDVADVADYAAIDQPGNDGKVLLADLPLVGEEVSLECRPGRIVREGLTQYRLTLAGGGEPAGFNNFYCGSIASAVGSPPELDLLVAPHIGLWEM